MATRSTGKETRPQERRRRTESAESRQLAAAAALERELGVSIDRQTALPVTREVAPVAKPQPRPHSGVVWTQPPGLGAGEPVHDDGDENSFAFMRRFVEKMDRSRFAERMDRLFTDFGFARTPAPHSAEGSPARNGHAASSSANGAAIVDDTVGQPRLMLSSAPLDATAGRDVAKSVATVARGSWQPQIEVVRRGEKLIVRAELPGMPREDMSVELTDDMLTIQGERKPDVDDAPEGYYRTERRYGAFHRAVPLPEGVNIDKSEAVFQNGLLEVTIHAPKKVRRVRKLEIR